jgi:hypothetical protein
LSSAVAREARGMGNLPDKSSYWSKAEGRCVVEAWRRSGETATAFARRHGLRAKRIVYWSERVAARAETPRVSFVQAAVVTADEPVIAVAIHVPGGVTIELARATPDQIAAVAAAVARSSS